MPPRPRTLPRKKAVQARSQATVEAILTATARVLVGVGYDRASTNRIAAAAGVSVGSLYQYFPSKEALVAALAERHIDEMSTVVLDAMARHAGAPAEETVRALVEVMIQAHGIDPKLHKVLVEQTPRFGRLEKLHDVEARVTELAVAWLEAHAAEIRPVDPAIAAFVIVHAVEALTHGAVLTRPDLLRDPRLVDEITALVVRYLG